MESTSDTAERAADPTLLTIMVSAVPIIEFKICSRTTGTRRLRIIRLVNICCCSIVTSSAPLIYDLTKQKKIVCILSITLSLTLYPFPALFPIYFLCFLYKLENAAGVKPAAVVVFCVFYVASRLLRIRINLYMYHRKSVCICQQQYQDEYFSASTDHEVLIFFKKNCIAPASVYPHVRKHAITSTMAILQVPDHSSCIDLPVPSHQGPPLYQHMLFF